MDRMDDLRSESERWHLASPLLMHRVVAVCQLALNLL